MSAGQQRWQDACLAAAMMAVDGRSVGGIWLLARAGAVRAQWLAAAEALIGPVSRVPPGCAAERLTGGLDLTATLSSGRPVHRTGLLDLGRPLVLPMAERIEPGIAALIGQAIDRGASAIALDERAEPEEALPPLLADRLGIVVVLEGVAHSDCLEPMPGRDTLAAAEARLPAIRCPEPLCQRLAETSLACGTGLRALLQAHAVARLSAALAGRSAVGEEDLAAALRLVLAPRAVSPPGEADQPPDRPPEPPAEEQAENDTSPRDQATPPVPDEIVIEAARAALPQSVLTALMAGQTIRAAGRGGQGAERQGALRGRPAGVRAGMPGAGVRLDVPATLRAAAPWQRLRGRQPGAPVRIRAEDFRITRYRERAETLTVFAVDASGSAAMARLAEAKGAVEIMLAEAYRRRDHVAVIGFRGTGAELLLPPTRALARAKRALGGLPGGGGTPLAAGLAEAYGLASTARRRGQTVALVVLTDGRANVPLTPDAPRSQAEDDAMTLARAIRAAGLSALLLDTGRRPRAEAERLAVEMGARYLPMPQADPAALGHAIRGDR